MAKKTPRYHFTSGKYSAERLAISKLDELIGVIQQLVEKLDNDTGLSDEDYAALSEELKTMRESIRVRSEDL